jgi:hypothetical protein
MDFDNQLVSNAVAVLHTVQDRLNAAVQLILCDPILSDPASSLETSQRSLTRIVVECPELEPALAPYLVPVDRNWAGERLLQDSIELAIQEARCAAKAMPAPRSITAWLFVSPAQERLLRTRLSKRALLRTTVRSAEEKQFRYWDPRVFAQLPRVLGAEEFRNWLGVDVCWCWIDARGIMQYADLVSGGPHQPSSDPELLARLRRIAEINQCLVHTEKAGKDDAALAGAYFDALLIHAENTGCRTPADRMTYAVLADSLGKGFEQASQLSNYFERFLSGEAALTACAATVPQNVWDDVRKTNLRSAEHLREIGNRS